MDQAADGDVDQDGLSGFTTVARAGTFVSHSGVEAEELPS